MFNTFSRAFFASPRDMSTAELIKSFHFFFLSHDGGLIYDYPDDDYQVTLLDPIRALLEGHGARIHLGQAVEQIGLEDGKFTVQGETFDHLILASDVVGTRSIVEHSPALQKEYPGLAASIGNLHASRGYAVLRVWADRDAGEDLPGFIITEKKKLLDSVSFYHRLEKSSVAWSQERGGFVFELHCYALPEDATSEKAVRDGLLEEFFFFFPDMKGCTIHDEHLQMRHDFPAFHTGMHDKRPGHRTPVPGLYLAGDWVKLERPAMLMEAACTSGLLCANEILERRGLRTEPLYSVPPRGLLAGD
jgi:isorenieratene synthase